MIFSAHSKADKCLGHSRRTSNRRRFEEILLFSIRAEEIGDETHALVEIRPVLGAGTMFAFWRRIEAREQLQDIRAGQRTKVVWKRSYEVATQLDRVRRRQPPPPGWELVACRTDNVTADAAGRIGIFPVDLPELLHGAADSG